MQNEVRRLGFGRKRAMKRKPNDKRGNPNETQQPTQPQSQQKEDENGR